MADHPVKVPPEVFAELLSEALLNHDHKSGTVAAMVANRAAQWGADQELEACCVAIKNLEWFVDPSLRIAELRAARRPKPPTLAEQGLKALGRPVDPSHFRTLTATEQDAIRAALNRLAELEGHAPTP